MIREEKLSIPLPGFITLCIDYWSITVNVCKVSSAHARDVKTFDDTEAVSLLQETNRKTNREAYFQGDYNHVSQDYPEDMK